MSYTSGEPERNARGGALAGRRDFALGLPDFSYADLHDPKRLADLAAAFDRALETADPALFASFLAYRRSPESLGPVDRSNLLIGVGGHLSRFLAALFQIDADVKRAVGSVQSADPVFVFKRDFLQRRALKKRRPNDPPPDTFPSLDLRVRAL